MGLPAELENYIHERRWFRSAAALAKGEPDGDNNSRTPLL
jgi:hypothetical protein